ncbi:MAG: helix-turn-helix domain-containing protein [Bryobacterales bacterium]|nr:helix-turn-helix domain-containing protein [Bryobacterales bacterium]
MGEFTLTIHEKHYTVEEVADRLNVSRETARRMFWTEPGVIKWSRQRSKYRRSYTTLRIPESVFIRVYRRLQVGSGFAA